MAIFKIKHNKFVKIKEKRFDYEKVLQKLVEQNLEEVFGLEFVSTEFNIGGLWVDTLAFSQETNSFVIIEYKKDKNMSVIDQGFSYLAIMLNNKADFILDYNEKKKSNLKRSDVDWSQALVYFVSPSFTSYQQSAINFKDLPIKLWQVTHYENDLILFNQIKAKGATESIKNLRKSKEIQKVSVEVKEYKEADVIGNDKKINGLYEKLKEKINLFDPNLTPNATKTYVGFRLPDNWRNIFSVKKSWLNKKSGKGLLIEFTRSRPKDYKDPEGRLEYVKNSMKYFNQHMSRMYVYNEKDVDYATLLLKQAYDRFVDEFYSKG